MGNKVNYTIVGIFVIVLTAALIGGILFLSNTRRSAEYNTYLVYMNEAVSGLSIQAPVKYNGVDVGYVEDINLNTVNLQQVVLTLKIKRDTPITQSTVATLMSQGVTGITYVGLKATQTQSPPLTAAAGEPYPVIPSEPSLLVQLDTALREVTDNIKDISQVFLKTFDQQNQTAIKQSLQNIAKVSQTLANSSKQIDNILQQTSKASNQFPTVMTQLSQTLKSAQQMTQQLTTTAKNVDSVMARSQVAVQNISDQTVPTFTQTLQKLNEVLNDAQQLTGELKENPGVLLRGKQLPPPGPGE